mgnify:CR=1 FL=1
MTTTIFEISVTTHWFPIQISYYPPPRIVIFTSRSELLKGGSPPVGGGGSSSKCPNFSCVKSVVKFNLPPQGRGGPNIGPAPKAIWLLTPPWGVEDLSFGHLPKVEWKMWHNKYCHTSENKWNLARWNSDVGWKCHYDFKKLVFFSNFA